MLADSPVAQLARSLRINWGLPGAENKIACNDSLAVESLAWGGSLVGRDNLLRVA